MRIENLREHTNGDRSRVSATVIWENSDRPVRELFFETTAPFADDLTPDPNAFLVAAILPAMANGEHRVLVEGRLCPELKDNLAVATGWVRKWYGPPRRPIDIQATLGVDLRPSPRPPRAASLLSGGIDSLATLRSNRLNFPLDHPRSIKDCLVLHGFDIGAHENGPSENFVFDRTMACLSRVAQETNINLIPVFTNVRHLDGDSLRFNREYHGAMLAAAAHVFSTRLTSVFISSSKSYDDHIPLGSHPLLDPYYSSSGLQVQHVGFQYSRLDKVRMVAQWPTGLSAVRVCIRNPVDKINCGECQKCIRTMLELYVTGHLANADTFPGNDICVAQVRKLRWGFFRFHAHYLVELYPHLRKMGRTDLVRMIEKRRRQYRVFYASAERLGLIKFAKLYHRRFFTRSLTRLLDKA